MIWFGFQRCGVTSIDIDVYTLRRITSLFCIILHMTEKRNVHDLSTAKDSSFAPEAPKAARKELYQDPNYITLYRYENKTIPYDESREGIVSKRTIIGAWFTNSLDDLRTYFISRVQGTRGGNFVTVRVKKEDLAQYDATTHPETKDMDIETGNYIIPSEIITETGLFLEAPFKDEWEGKKNLPIKDWSLVKDFIQSNLNNEALQNIA